MDFMVFLFKRKTLFWTSSDKDIGYVATERVVHRLTAQKRKEHSYAYGNCTSPVLQTYAKSLMIHEIVHGVNASSTKNAESKCYRIFGGGFTQIWAKLQLKLCSHM